MLYADEYWFIQSIVLLYIPFYYCAVYLKSNKKLIAGITVTIIMPCIYVLITPKVGVSIFHADLHYFCHFPVMLLGGLTYKLKGAIRLKGIVDLIMLGLSFALYFLFMAFGKGQDDYWYYSQLLCFGPLLAFCFYSYKVFSQKWCICLFENGFIKWPLLLVSMLTLEIYIVQSDIITDCFNGLFPLNTIIVFMIICGAACCLHILATILSNYIFYRKFRWL